MWLEKSSTFVLEYWCQPRKLHPARTPTRQPENTAGNPRAWTLTVPSKGCQAWGKEDAGLGISLPTGRWTLCPSIAGFSFLCFSTAF